MPLWKLQRVGDEVLDFLYDNAESGTSVTLKPGVAYCLRAYYDLLRDLIQGAWARYVRKVNGESLGDVADLGVFLFGQERSSLDQYRPILMDVQAGRCFYCRKSLDRGNEVDHFIPWSRYPADLGHNFVLAHPACNARKSDFGLLWKSRALERSERFAEAIPPAEMAVVLASPRYPQIAFEAEYHLGRILQRQGDELRYGWGPLHVQAMNHYGAALAVALTADLPESKADSARLQYAYRMRDLGMLEKSLAWLRMGIEDPAMLDKEDTPTVRRT